MKLVIIGCGGHGRAVLEIARRCGHQVVGFIDDDARKQGSVVDDIPVLGGIDLLMDWPDAERPHGAVVAVGNNHRRAELFYLVRERAFLTPSLIHPGALIATHTEIGEGVVVMPRTVINPGVKIEDNVCVKTAAKVDHDCVLHRHYQIYPSTTLTGGVEVGEYSYVGSAAVVNPYLKIGNDSFVGSGAVVICDIPDGVVAVGVPARTIKARRTSGELMGSTASTPK